MKPKKNIKLADLTTIKLGGIAEEFVAVETIDELKKALQYADKKNMPVWILSGGSNTVFKDEGFNGLVVKVDLKGVKFKASDGYTFVAAAAGEIWDDVVKKAIAKNLVGIEALSGIPGSVGGTPIQNVGAYGQEVSDVIFHVKALDRRTLKEASFTNGQCEFGYRMSRFKGYSKDRYIITEVTYRLFNGAKPVVHYAQLSDKLTGLFGTLDVSLKQIRKAVLALRKSKSMVLDSRDPNSRSCGSFFTNPVLSQKEFAALSARWHASRKQVAEEIPFFETSEHRIKVPAAWLIEHAGFQRGHAHGAVGISENHTLALVNRNGTTEELLEFAGVIRTAVRQKFGITLELEPIIAE
ncbi:MAG: UDP-N-acetylmuramate dehydrogenase [Parcubacteria group bacterium]|nr:UDP-N-acetylmuramate dehydrogenase [Parcubacteria group bacterium]